MPAKAKKKGKGKAAFEKDASGDEDSYASSGMHQFSAVSGDSSPAVQQEGSSSLSVPSSLDPDHFPKETSHVVEKPSSSSEGSDETLDPNAYAQPRAKHSPPLEAMWEAQREEIEWFKKTQRLNNAAIESIQKLLERVGINHEGEGELNPLAIYPPHYSIMPYVLAMLHKILSQASAQPHMNEKWLASLEKKLLSKLEGIYAIDRGLTSHDFVREIRNLVEKNRALEEQLEGMREKISAQL